MTRFEIAMDPASGRAVVLWSQSSDTSNSGAWARHFAPASGWTAARTLSAATGVVDVMSVGMDAQGNAVAAWSQLDGSRFSIWGSRGSVAGSWGTAQLLETMDEWVVSTATRASRRHRRVTRSWCGRRAAAPTRRYTSGR